jgi:hypothetical protein
MQKISVELNYNQVEDILVTELKNSYRRHLDDTDEEYLNAIDCVLDHYMTVFQKEDWVETKRVLGR